METAIHCLGVSLTTSATRTTSPKKGEKKAALSRELSEFLVELSIAVHRYSMYPPNHPSLQPAAENVITGLTGLLQDRRQLSLGVAQRQLIIEEIATDEKHPVLSDLARRLHAHQLGSVTFQRGATLDEVVDLLTALSEEPERGGDTLGLLPPEERPSWKHIRIHPVGYDRLEMEGDREGASEPSRPRQLWLRLARAALKLEGTESGEDADGRSLARVIQERGGDGGYDQVIVGYLRQLAEELKDAEGAEARATREMMSQLVQEMDPSTLRRMVELGGSQAERKRFLLDATQGGLTVQSVVRILEAAAEVEGQNISTSLTRLLSKLASHADTGPKRLRAEAESAIREQVEELIEDWELEDPNPDAYTRLLDGMARAAPILQGALDEEEDLPGSERVVQMALEVDAGGPTLQKAVSDLLDEGEVARLFQMLDQAPQGSRIAQELYKHLTSPAQLRRLLGGEDVGEASLRALVDRIGPAAVEPLFQFLAESESRSIRRKVFDCLARMEYDATPRILEHLEDERWFVQRNMLALLQRTEGLPDGFEPMRYLKHSDPRVRREALPLALRDPSVRERALALALADQDERTVRAALLEVQKGLPDTLAPVVVNRILRSDAFPQLRGLAVRALGTTRSALALQALLDLCSGGRTLFGRRRLASKSPELLAGLSALARNWGEDPGAAGLLARARKSRDPQVRAAAAFSGDRP